MVADIIEYINMINLYAHQQALLNKNPAKYLIAHSTGTGKTISVLSLAQKNKVTALIIVPKALKENWNRQIQSFDPQHKVVTKEEFKRDHLKLEAYRAIIVDECHTFASMSSQLSKSLDKYIKRTNPQFIWLL